MMMVLMDQRVIQCGVNGEGETEGSRVVEKGWNWVEGVH